MKIPHSIRLLAAAVILCFGLLGCEPKAMTAFAAWEPEIVLYPGDTWEGDIPTDGKAPEYSVTVNTVPGLDAVVEDGRLTLTAHQAGEGQLTLAASSKGYHNTTLTLPVRVEPLPLEISWELVADETEEDEDGESERELSVWVDSDRVGAKVGETFTLAFHAAKAEHAAFELFLSPNLGEAEVEGNLATITAGEEYGEGFLTVTATAPDYGSNMLSIPFSVVQGRLPLAITSQGAGIATLEMDRDSSVTVSATTEDGAEVTADLAPNAGGSTAAPAFDAKLSRDGGSFTITASAIGEGTLTVTARAEGWLENSVSIPVKIVKPTAVVTPESDDVTVEPGHWVGVPLTIWPTGATVTASVEESGFTAEVTGSTLTIAADENAQGSATVKLTVSADTYNSGSASVKATAKPAPVQLTASEDTLILRTGETGIVTLTATPADAKITVTSEDGVTAQYSDGKLTVTGKASGTAKVTASAEGRDSATLTLKVIIADGGTLPEVNTAAYAEDAAEIIRLTNQYRTANGVGALTHVEVLDVPAGVRAYEAAEYWSHTRPDGSEFVTIFAQCGLKYAAYGENLFAVNTSFTPEEVLQEWKDSPSHNENLLRKEFDGIGVGICKVDGEYYYCQLFITEK